MQIGFKNFRRFKNFPKIELGGCTFLVGSNNSGKSTLIKANILLQNNRSKKASGGATDPLLWNFSFAPEKGQAEHFYLGDFFSNLHEGVEDRVITFRFESGNSDFVITLDGSSLNEDEPSILVPVKEIIACNHEYDITYKWKYFDSVSGEVEYTYNPKLITSWLRDFWYDVTDGRRDFISGKYRKDWDQFAPPSLDDGFLDHRSREIDEFADELGQIDGIKTESEEFYAQDRNLSYEDSARRNYYLTRFLRDARSAISKDFNSFTSISYIEAHNASHKVILNPEDKNDYLAQTVLKFKSEIGADSQEEAINFVKKWMRSFNLGEAFEIKSLYNEAYTVDILSANGQRRAIGNYGTGSIQLFILLLNIAIGYVSKEKVTFCIEEPEQNLHPALQSKLADMFYEVWKETESRIAFIVETHSEYLIRHIQVLVAKTIKKGDMNTPFKVFYFSGNDERPFYDMGFQKNGKFKEEFGPGFFNVADDAAMELYDLDDDAV